MNADNDSARAMGEVVRMVMLEDPVDTIDTALDTLTTDELNRLSRTAHELASFVSYATMRRINGSRTAAVRRNRSRSRTTDSRTEPFTGDLPMTGDPYPLT